MLVQVSYRDQSFQIYLPDRGADQTDHRSRGALWFELRAGRRVSHRLLPKVTAEQLPQFRSRGVGNFPQEGQAGFRSSDLKGAVPFQQGLSNCSNDRRSGWSDSKVSIAIARPETSRLRIRCRKLGHISDCAANLPISVTQTFDRRNVQPDNRRTRRYYSITCTIRIQICEAFEILHSTENSE